MARSTRARPKNGKGPPSPKNHGAFQNWLAKQPPEWSSTIAVRAALRVLPLLRDAKDSADLILPVFRSTAIARFAARYPPRVLTAAAKAAAAAAAVAAADVAHAAGAASASAAARAAAAAASAYATDATRAAAAAAANTADAVYRAVKHDAQQLYDLAATPGQLAAAPLWLTPSPPGIGGAWQDLALELRARGDHWSIWIDWYDDVVAGAPHAVTSESEDAAFTDIPDKLPWDDGAEVANREIARRLQALRKSGAIKPAIPAPKLDAEGQKARTIARLAEVASPQPSVTDKGQLDAGPNQPFDVPTVDDDLSALPRRQRNLIRVILDDLPENAPKHLKSSLRSYDEELKVRGVQPILGLLKDDADIIAAAVTAPRAEDEWLEPGMRKAFDRFGENHTLFVEHFPLDAEREAVYAQTPLDEEQAAGKKLIEPFEMVAKAAREAHKVGATTDDFVAVIDRMTELARVLSTQPSAPLPNRQILAQPGEIKVSPEDRIQPVTTKKRVILGALGFFGGAYALIGTTVTITTANYAGVAEALKSAIDMLMRFLG